MRVLITGICGFAGSTIARALREAKSGLEVMGLDNFIRPGSELNRQALRSEGIEVLHGDIRSTDDTESLPAADWVIDAAANPSVLAGVGGSGTSSRQLMQHNLAGTVNVLEYCHAHQAGFILLSTSRVYAIEPLAKLQVEPDEDALHPVADQAFPAGVSPIGVDESFSTTPPLSLYGVSKRCSELLAIEYGQTFNFPVWINRLGVLAGAGQFGRADQGIFSFWIHSCATKRPLRFIGFGGCGHQVRDCLHPRDVIPVLLSQMSRSPAPGEAVTNLSGGLPNSMSLLQLHRWCETRFGQHTVAIEPATRTFDLPWMVLDSSMAKRRFGWEATTTLPAILEEIALHAAANPRWLDLTT